MRQSLIVMRQSLIVMRQSLIVKPCKATHSMALSGVYKYLKIFKILKNREILKTALCTR